MVLLQNATALTCSKRHSPYHMMDRINKGTEPYAVLVGDFTSFAPFDRLDRRHQERFDYRNAKVIRARFTGVSLTQDNRVDIPLSNIPIVIENRCFYGCREFPPTDTTFIIFVKLRDPLSPLLEIGYCSGTIFPVRQKPWKIQKLKECFDGPCIANKQ